MKSSNPALSNRIWENMASAGSDTMTINGTVNKSFILLALIVMMSALSWQWTTSLGGMNIVSAPLLIGGIGGFILALVTIFKPAWSAFTAPAYALFEGVLLGSLSATFEVQYPGIVGQAMILTFGTLFSLLMMYRAGWIKVTKGFRTGVMIATGCIALVYLLSFILSIFHVNLPFLSDASPLSIIISIVILIVAAMNLLLDFDFIEQSSNQGLPKYMEWYGAFGLMVTLIWLYLEFLRLLSKLRSRN